MAPELSRRSAAEHALRAVLEAERELSEQRSALASRASDSEATGVATDERSEDGGAAMERAVPAAESAEHEPQASARLRSRLQAVRHEQERSESGAVARARQDG